MTDWNLQFPTGSPNVISGWQVQFPIGSSSIVANWILEDLVGAGFLAQQTSILDLILQEDGGAIVLSYGTTWNLQNTN